MRICKRCPEKGPQPEINFFRRKVRKVTGQKKWTFETLCKVCYRERWPRGKWVPRHHFDRRTVWNKTVPTKLGIREKLVARGLTDKAPGWRAAYVKEYDLLFPEDKKLCGRKTYLNRKAKLAARL